VAEDREVHAHAAAVTEVIGHCDGVAGPLAHDDDDVASWGELAYP